MAETAEKEEPRARRRDETFQETLVREDERRLVREEMEDEEAASVERSRAFFAMALLTTIMGAILLPIWGAILGGAWWVMRTVATAPSPW